MSVISQFKKEKKKEKTQVGFFLSKKETFNPSPTQFRIGRFKLYSHSTSFSLYF